MPKKLLVPLKILAHLACLAPLGWLVYAYQTHRLGFDPPTAVLLFTGLGTLRLLAITLAISPLRRLSPKRLGWLIRFRRLLGLYTFFYACVHLLSYVLLYGRGNFSDILTDLSMRHFIWAGIAAWLLLLPLALTSTRRAIRWMGGKAWSRLHRLIYLAAIAGLVHFWWGLRSTAGKPMLLTLVIGFLLFIRLWSQPRPDLRQKAEDDAA